MDCVAAPQRDRHLTTGEDKPEKVLRTVPMLMPFRIVPNQSLPITSMASGVRTTISGRSLYRVTSPVTRTVFPL
jgi:hypothetical protein